MQPFGLFQLLQALLPTQKQQNESPSPPIADKPTAKNAPLPSVDTAAQPNVDTAAQSAVLDFMEAHDRRAKRLR